MSDFQPGDMVECVDAHTGKGVWLPGEEVVEGAIYTIASIFSHPRGSLAVRLKEVARHPYAIKVWGHDGYGAERFRKVYRPKADLIQRLTAEPVFPSSRVKEDA